MIETPYEIVVESGVRREAWHWVSAKVGVTDRTFFETSSLSRKSGLSLCPDE